MIRRAPRTSRSRLAVAIVAGLAIALLTGACGGGGPLPGIARSATPAGSVSHGSLQSGGLTRTYRLFVPAVAPRALIVALHGHGGTGDRFADETGFDEVAGPQGFEVVYPDGVDNAWNAGFCCGDPIPGTDDVALIAGLFARLGQPGWKLFLAGFSNGGFLAYRFACERPAAATAIAVDGADSQECSPHPPLPAILHVQGTLDDLTGNRVWALRNGAWVNSEPSATARWLRLGADVTLVSVPGGRHEWYRANPSTTRLAVDFFAERL